MDTVAAVEPEALQNGAGRSPRPPGRLRSSTTLRVRYFGRNSELKLALREVRDRETGMALNAVRERLEAAFAEREAALERAEPRAHRSR